MTVQKKKMQYQNLTVYCVIRINQVFSDVQYLKEFPKRTNNIPLQSTFTFANTCNEFTRFWQ